MTTPAGREPGPHAEFTPVTQVKVGQVIGEGEVTAIRASKSGKTVYFTCVSVTGEKEWGHSAGAKVAVFTQPAARCAYQPAEGDPAVRVCVTHDPGLGLYGDEWCAQDNGGAS
jgi:hypothetical protein